MNQLAKETARKLRRNCTTAENIFWNVVRRKNLDGKKFYRQYIIKFETDNQQRFFIADFYCHEKKLVIELDGKIHENQKEYDDLRTLIIEQLGISVIRFSNDEIENNLENVINKIRKEFLKSPLLGREGI